MFNFIKSALGIGSKVAPKIAQGVRSAITGLTRNQPRPTTPITPPRVSGPAGEQLSLLRPMASAARAEAEKRAASQVRGQVKKGIISSAERKQIITQAGDIAESNARAGFRDIIRPRPVTPAREVVEEVGPLPGQLRIPFGTTPTRGQKVAESAGRLGADVRSAYAPRFRFTKAGRAEEAQGMTERAASIYRKRPFISAATGLGGVAGAEAAGVPEMITDVTSGLPSAVQPFAEAGLTAATYAVPFGLPRLLGTGGRSLKQLLIGLGIGTGLGGTAGLLTPEEQAVVAETPATVTGASPSLDITQEDVDNAALSELELIDQAYNEALNRIIEASNAGLSDEYLNTQLAAIEQERAAAEAQLQQAYDAATAQVTSNTAQMNQLMQDFARQAMADYQATAGNIPMAGIPGLTGEQAGMAGVSSTALGGAGITGMSEANALATAANLGNLANILSANVESQDILNQLAQERALAQAGLAGNVAEAQAAARLADVERRAEAARALELGKADIELSRARALADLAGRGVGRVYKPTKQPTWYNTRIPAVEGGLVPNTSITVEQANNILSSMDTAIASGDLQATPREFWNEWYTSAAESVGGFPVLIALLTAAGRPTTVDGLIADTYA